MNRQKLLGLVKLICTMAVSDAQSGAPLSVPDDIKDDVDLSHIYAQEFNAERARLKSLRIAG